MSDWRSYLHDRLIKDEPEGFFVIVPVGADPPVPIACSVCTALFRSRDDETAHREYGCCDLCAMQWAHPRRKEWAAGWRPSKTDVETVVSSRPPLPVVFSVD